MKKNVLFISLFVGLFTSCSSSEKNEDTNSKDTYSTYQEEDFVKYIESQYTNTNKSVLIIKCDNQVNLISNMYNSDIAVSGFALIRDNNQYCIDGYKYEGKVINQEWWKIYDAKRSKAFSLTIDTKSELNVLLYGQIISRNTDRIDWKKDGYQIKRSDLFDNCLDIIVGGSRTTTNNITMDSFLKQCQIEVNGGYPNLILGKWENSKGTKIFEFKADSTVVMNNSIYQYRLSGESISIWRIENIFTRHLEESIINLLTDNELQMMNDYTPTAWNKREIYHKVSE